jgi:hypothetical protein
VHCPRCGAQTEKDDRYCASCGATLKQDTGPERSPRERFEALIGTSRRERLISGGIALAVVVAIVAIFALPTDEVEVPQDDYTEQADEICVQAKEQIIAAADATGGPGAPPGAGAPASTLVSIVAEWRAILNDLPVPRDRIQLVAELDTALREVEIEAAVIARAAREGADSDRVEGTRQADEAATRVNAAVEDLGLEKCDAIAVGLAPAAP